MSTKTRKSQQYIINIIKTTRRHHPNFALFLGAGASVSSGVKSAKEMIIDWKKQLVEIHPKKSAELDDDSHIASCGVVSNSENQYSVLFEHLYDRPSQRREYIEECIGNASPSWGYIFLVNLIAKEVFNAVFTTNFDDLINEACYLHSDKVRPIVCAHDSSITSVRITSKRPKIIKLHGDFLFDNIKNTERELESLETNMRDKFRQYASEFGLIVIGYSGNDRSIMDTVNTLLRSDRNFPHGVYWCVRKGASVSRHVDLLTRFPNFHIIEIDGFDDFFAELHEQLGFDIQAQIKSPHLALKDKLNNLFSETRVSEVSQNPIIQKHIKNLTNSLQEIERTVSSDSSQNVVAAAKRRIIKSNIPYQLLAQQAFVEKRYDAAIEYINEDMASLPNAKSIALSFRILPHISKDVGFYSKAIEWYKLHKSLVFVDGTSCNAIMLACIPIKEFDIALECASAIDSIVLGRNGGSQVDVEFNEINKSQIYIHKGDALPSDLQVKVRAIMESSADSRSQLGAAVVLGEKERSRSILESINKVNSGFMQEFMSWPIGVLYGKLHNG